jgi:hypothetical protein
MVGYWEAISTVVDQRGIVLGRGVGCVFDDEKPWNTRPQFARQMMAQTRATGRALKGVMGWAFALLGTASSLHEEMPEEAATTPQDGTEGVRRLPTRPSAPKASKGEPVALREVRGVCAEVECKVSKAGTKYWRIGIEAGEATEWFTSFKPIPELAGRLLLLKLVPHKDGVLVEDCIDMEVD